MFVLCRDEDHNWSCWVEGRKGVRKKWSGKRKEDERERTQRKQRETDRGVKTIFITCLSLSQFWLSKADFTWLIVISHRYVLVLHYDVDWLIVFHNDGAVARHLLVVICWLIHDSRLWSYDVWLLHMTHSYESWVSHMWPDWGHMICFISFDWFWYVAQLTHRSQLMDFTLWLVMSHESYDVEYESHRVRVEGRTHYKKGALAA